jgi:hypothetical protein
MITPWAINLLCLPGNVETWPAAGRGVQQARLAFSVRSTMNLPWPRKSSLGNYHLCSLFSPALEFDTPRGSRA